MKLLDYIILVDTKAKMSLKAEASKLYLSFLWWVLEPILFVLAFYFVFNVLQQSGQSNYLLFLMCAKIPYMWFSKSVTSASGSIVANRGIISQIDIPKSIFPYAAIQICMYKEALVFLLLISMCISYGFHPTIQWLWMIPLILIEYLMIVVFGLITAILVCYADDVRMLINIAMLFLMFTSGIFFDIDGIHEPLRGYLLAYNPVAFICNGFRGILMQRGMYSIDHMLYLFMIFLSLTILMHTIYSKMNRTLASQVVNT